MINALCYISLLMSMLIVLLVTLMFNALLLCRVCFNYTLIYLLPLYYLGGIEGGVALSGIRASLSVCQFVSCLFVSVCVGLVVLVVVVGWLCDSWMLSRSFC